MTIETGPAPAVHRVRRQRRPSGAPPPLPRSIGVSGKGWAVAMVALLLWVLLVTRTEWARRVTERADAAFLREIARLRTDWLTDVFEPVNRIASGWTITVISVGLLIAMMVFRRWRHLFTFLGAVLVVGVARRRRLQLVLTAAPVRCHDHRRLAQLLVPVWAGAES